MNATMIATFAGIALLAMSVCGRADVFVNTQTNEHALVYAQRDRLCPHSEQVLACIVAHAEAVTQLRLRAMKSVLLMVALFQDRKADALRYSRALIGHRHEFLKAYHGARAQFSVPKNKEDWAVVVELEVLVEDVRGVPIGTVHSVSEDRDKVLVSISESFQTSRYIELDIRTSTVIHGYWNGVWKMFVPMSHDEIAKLPQRSYP